MRQATDASGLPDQHGNAVARDTRAGSGLRRSDGISSYGDTRLKKPIADEDREAVRRLIEAGKMIRRADGRWGTASRPLITGAVAARLKARSLAVSAFDKQTMYPSDKGKRLYAEMKK
jgi:hypothetical protein